MPKLKPIPNLVRIPSEGSGPVWQDGIGHAYVEVRDRFMALLRLMFPSVAVFEHKLPPAQRHDYFPNIPNIGEFYPRGILAPFVQMTPEQQEALNILYIEIGKAIREAYNNGLDHGRDLLMGLAKGEISTTDFNDGIVKEADDGDNSRHRG
jgi:hypothetical protein